MNPNAERISTMPLSEAEVQSLRQVESLCYRLRGERPPFGLSTRLIAWCRVHLLGVRISPPPLLEGRTLTRWLLDPQVIFVQGETEAFAHRPTVGTTYRTTGRTGVRLRPLFRLKQLVRSCVRSNPQTVFRTCLPLPPQSLRDERQTFAVLGPTWLEALERSRHDQSTSLPSQGLRATSGGRGKSCSTR